MLSASRMACLIEATVESMLTMTPFLRPREGCVPTPMMSSPSGPISPTTAAILVVPMSSPTMMSDDLRGMEVVHLHGLSGGAQIFSYTDLLSPVGRRGSSGGALGPVHELAAVFGGAMRIPSYAEGQPFV